MESHLRSRFLFPCQAGRDQKGQKTVTGGIKVVHEVMVCLSQYGATGTWVD